MSNRKEAGKELTFEEALVKLEAIVAAMESGDLSLEDSMNRFEEGMKLAKLCGGKLGETEKKIEVLLRKAGEEPCWTAIETEPVP